MQKICVRHTRSLNLALHWGKLFYLASRSNYLFNSSHNLSYKHNRNLCSCSSVSELCYVFDIKAICLIYGLLIFVQLQAFKHRFIVNNPIDKVWEFYTDVKHLEIVTPKEMRLKIINTTSEKLIQGSEIWLEAKLIIFKTRWHSLIRSLKPYQYLDEMVKGPFKRWTHLYTTETV